MSSRRRPGMSGLNCWGMHAVNLCSSSMSSATWPSTEPVVQFQGLERIYGLANPSQGALIALNFLHPSWVSTQSPHFAVSALILPD